MLVGLCGLARSGKDTFFKFLKKSCESNFNRYAFADELKKECYDFVMTNSGISVYSENEHEKELIRPLLVAYGTHLRRAINPTCWIDRLEPQVNYDLRKGINVVITDVRYENELEWIHKLGGTSIYIETLGNEPRNSEERKHDPKLKLKAKHHFKWRFKDPSLPNTQNKVNQFLINNEIKFN